MGLKITKKPAKATVSEQTKNKGEVIAEDVKEETVEIPAEVSASTGGSVGPWCEVGVDASYTHNLGNFQSAKIGVSIKVPCLHGEVDEVFGFAKEWVDQRMQTMMEELQS